MSLTIINPESLGAPRGYANGVLTSGSRLLFISGQVAWDSQQKILSSDFVAQFDKALENLLTVVHEAGGKPDQITKLVIYVTTKAEYLANTARIGAVYRERMGRHYPAMVLIEVKSLLDDAAKVEIEGIAVFP